MTSSFDLKSFARTLLSETLYYDDEHGSIGSVSLFDAQTGKELYMASYDPDIEAWLLERATEWDDDDIEGLLMATDGESLGEFSDPLEIANEVLDLAAANDLTPMFLPLFEEPL